LLLFFILVFICTLLSSVPFQRSCTVPFQRRTNKCF